MSSFVNFLVMSLDKLITKIYDHWNIFINSMYSATLMFIGSFGSVLKSIGIVEIGQSSFARAICSLITVFFP